MFIYYLFTGMDIHFVLFMFIYYIFTGMDIHFVLFMFIYYIFTGMDIHCVLFMFIYYIFTGTNIQWTALSFNELILKQNLRAIVTHYYGISVEQTYILEVLIWVYNYLFLLPIFPPSN